MNQVYSVVYNMLVSQNVQQRIIKDYLVGISGYPNELPSKSVSTE
jgi:hypothetical protein